MAVDIAALTIAIDTLQAVKAGEDLDKLAAKGEKLSTSTEFLTGKMTALVTLLASAASVAGFVMMIKNAVELEASFVRLAQMSGTTAANISGMSLPAALAGASLESMAGAMGKLNREIGLAKLGDFGNKSQMLRAIGIDPTSGEDPAEVLLKVARALTSMKDPMIASKVAFDLLGRSYAELKPALIELVAQGGIHARVTDQEAEAAKELSDTWIRLKASFEDSALALTNQFVPALTAVLKQILAIKQSKISDLDVQALAGGVPLDFNVKQPTGSQADVRAADNAIIAATRGQQKSAEQANVEALLNNQKMFAQRMEQVKAQGAAYADAIKFAGELAALQYQETGATSLRAQEEALKQQQQLDDLAIQQQINAQKKTRSLELGRDPEDLQGKAKAANAAIALLNQARVENEALTEARIRALRAAAFDEQMRQAEATLAASAQAGASVANSLMTVREQEIESYNQRFSDLESFLAKRLVSEERAKKMREDLDKQHQFNLNNVNYSGIKSRVDIEKMGGDEQLQYYTGTLASITAAGAQHSRRLFEINKVASIANAIVRTYEGATAAYSWGWPLGPIFSAIILAAGLANVAAIRATQFGGGAAAPSVAAAAGGGLTPVVNVPPTPAASSVPGQGLTLIVEGNMIGNEDFVNNTLIPALQDAIGNRDVSIISGNSRQARNLSPTQTTGA